MIGLAISQPGRMGDRIGSAAPFAFLFAEGLYRVDGVYVPATSAFTVGRSSTKLAHDASGHWRSFPNDVAALTNRGLLIEPAATNVLRNASGLGAVAGSPGTFPTHWAKFAGGGPVLSVAGAGVEYGLPYVDIRLQGTSASSSGAAIHFEQTTAVLAAAGQAWTGSVFVRLIAGSLGNLSNLRLNLQEFNESGSSTLLHYGADVRGVVSHQPMRLFESRTVTAGATEYVRSSLEIAYGGGVTTDATLRLYCPQLELGTDATSPILTVGQSATRAADNVQFQFPAGPIVADAFYSDGSIETWDTPEGNVPVDPTSFVGMPITAIVVRTEA